MLTGRQLREARELLGLTPSRLATRTVILTAMTIKQAEAFDGEPQITIQYLKAIRQALERAGIEFTPNATSAGSSLMRRRHAEVLRPPRRHKGIGAAPAGTVPSRIQRGFHRIGVMLAAGAGGSYSVRREAFISKSAIFMDGNTKTGIAKTRRCVSR